MSRVISTCIQFIDKFTAPSKETLKAMRKMSSEAKAAGKSIKSAGDTIANAGSKMTKSVTVPIAGVGVAAVKTAADYESAMSNVQAITGATGDDFKKLTQLGKDLGASTAWSAQECAEAMQYTGMAGWTAQQNIDGLKGILDLASASGTELARTSDIMTDAISAFGYKASDSAKFADVMTKACTAANVSVDTLGESYKYCGAICGTMGYSIDEVTTSLAVMGNMGIKGSQAGTALKNAISNMAAPTKNMKAAMDGLGISITNQDGSMKSWGDVIKNLQGSFKGLSQDQQAAYAKQLFGKESMAGMLAIINTSTKDYNALADSIKNSGGAANDAAQTQLNNLNGQLTLLKSALEGAAITIGDKLLPYIKSAVTWVQKATDWFNGLSDAQVNTIMKIAGVVAAIGPAIMIFGKLTSGIGQAVLTFGKISGAIAKAGGVLGLITSPAGIVIGVLAGVAAAAFLIIKNWDKVKPAVMKVKDAFTSVMPSIKQTIANAISAAMPIITTLVKTFKDIIPKAINVAKTVIAAITPVIKTVVNTVSAIIPIIAKTFVSVAQKLTPAVKTIANVVKAAIPVIGKLFAAAFTFVGNTITKVMPYINRIAKVIGSVLVFAVKAVSPVVQKMASTFSIVFTSVFNIVSKIVNKLKPVFNGIGIVIKAVMAVVKTEITTAFRIAANVIESAAGSIKQVISGITKVFNGILDFISGVFTCNWKKAWEGVKNIFGGCFEALAGLCKVPINAVIGLINSAIEGINSISVDIPDGIPLVGGKHIGFSIPKIPALAKGTPNWLGGLAQINEKGGEIVDLPKGSRVYPHDESVSIVKNMSNAKLATLDRRLAKVEAGKDKDGGKKEVNINIPKLADQIIVRDKTDIDEIADKIATNLKNTALNMGVC
ncbi:MAG: phage tail tape measure protein [Eubacterium sp.]|nr:phage tail tape measure protein [Eubacterium sp.]